MTARPPEQEPEAWGALMARAQAGDAQAYRALLTGILPFVRALARRALRDGAEVEDAVQDILLSLHAARASYDPARPFRPWLAGVARHRLLDRRRALGRRGARETALGEEHETIAAVVANGTGPELDGAALRRALAQLPAGQRTAVELTKLRELSVKEAAAVSGMSEGAVKVATHRGLARLRRLLGGGGAE